MSCTIGWPLLGPEAVEAAGIEPASENYRREASTCLAHRFSFAGSKPGGPAQLSASLTEISLRRRQA